ncbi:MAG: hypothetical protein ACRBCS_01690 [Cellvibrionaceae bacterium]
MNSETLKYSQWPNFYFLESMFKKIDNVLDEWDRYELAGLLTLTLLAFYNYSYSWSEFLVPFFLASAIIYRPLLKNPWFWVAFASFATYMVGQYWQPVANHKFLTTYWLWILAFAGFVKVESKRYELLEFNARFLILFCMLCASIQKLLSPTYMDGSFFEMALLTETYFQFFGVILGVPPELPALTQSTVSAIQAPNITLSQSAVVLPITPIFHYFVIFVTVWNLGMQVLLEGLGLFKHRLVQVVFHVTMLIFLHSTYIAAPFTGFGWLLCVMLFVMAKPTFPRFATLYLVSIPILVLYTSPWRLVF